MTIYPQIALFNNIQSPISSFNSADFEVAVSIEQSVFLTEAEINSFMLIELDEASMNEMIDVGVIKCFASKTSVISAV